MFVMGAGAFAYEVFLGTSDRTIVLGALLLMGLPVVNRVDDAVRRNGNGK